MTPSTATSQQWLLGTGCYGSIHSNHYHGTISKVICVLAYSNHCHGNYFEGNSYFGHSHQPLLWAKTQITLEMVSTVEF